jgi:hypothetical protein
VRVRLSTAVLAVLLVGQPSAGLAQTCAAPLPVPSRPLVTFPKEPSTPACVNKASGTHRCANKIVDAHNREIAAYNDALQAAVDQVNRYTRQLRDYVNSSSDYADCESNIFRTQLRQAQSPTS